MTSNTKPNEIFTYFTHGMNDILAKPFSKGTLLDVLEVSFFGSFVPEAISDLAPEASAPSENRHFGGFVV